MSRTTRISEHSDGERHGEMTSEHREARRRRAPATRTQGGEMNERDPGAPRADAYQILGRFLRGETETIEFPKPTTAAQIIDAAFELIIRGQDATALADLARKLVHEQAKKIGELRAAREYGDSLRRRLLRYENVEVAPWGLP